MPRKISIVAVIAALSLVALVAAGSASATVLCTSNASSTCASPVPSGTNVFAVLNGGNAVLTTSGASQNPTLTCTVSNMTLQTTGAGGAGAPLPGQLTAYTFSGCNSVNPSGCSSSLTIGSLTNATTSASWTSGFNGTLTLTMPSLTFTCTYFGFPITCTFGGDGTTATGNFTGGAPATAAFNSLTLPSTGGGGGFACPTSLTMTMTYKTVTFSGGTTAKAYYLTNS